MVFAHDLMLLWMQFQTTSQSPCYSTDCQSKEYPLRSVFLSHTGPCILFCAMFLFNFCSLWSYSVSVLHCIPKHAHVRWYHSISWIQSRAPQVHPVAVWKADEAHEFDWKHKWNLEHGEDDENYRIFDVATRVYFWSLVWMMGFMKITINKILYI